VEEEYLENNQQDDIGLISWQNHILQELHGHYVQQWLYIGLYFLLKDGWFKP